MEFKLINPDIIRESLMHNDSMIKQFVDLYLIQCPLDFQNLTESIAKRIPTEIGSAAHHIKPTMAYIGAIELKNDFQELEKLGNHTDDLAEIIKKYEEIKPKFERMLDELKEFIS